ncbi:MAG: gliding motility-associated C-terminal domain-containing protein, partial [Haliscomenobacter sp.]
SGSSGRWFSLTPGARLSDSLKLQPSASQLRPGENYFVWEIDRGICGASSRDTVVIRYTRSPEAVQDSFSVPFGEAFIVPVLKNDLYSGRVRLRIIVPPTRGTLQLHNDSVLVYTPAVNYVGEDAFRYELCSTGCTCSTAEVELEVGKEAGCDVPTIITPNNDGINDTFIVPCLIDEGAYPNNQILIFNRSGQEVYRSRQPYQNNWQGTYNGEPLPVGTYFYVIDFGDGSTPVRGFFVIQR